MNVQGRKGQHYLTGQYYISKVTDYISSQGFVKTMQIIKNTASRLAAGIELDGKMDFDTLSSISSVDSIASNIRAALQGLVDAGKLTNEQANIIANAGKAGPKTDEQKAAEESAMHKLNQAVGKEDEKKQVFENTNGSYNRPIIKPDWGSVEISIKK